MDNEEGKYSEVYVWGEDSEGQLGLCGQFADLQVHSVPKICSFNVVISNISCGRAHTVFVSDSGHVYSMGSNTFG